MNALWIVPLVFIFVYCLCTVMWWLLGNIGKDEPLTLREYHRDQWEQIRKMRL